MAMQLASAITCALLVLPLCPAVLVHRGPPKKPAPAKNGDLLEIVKQFSCAHGLQGPDDDGDSAMMKNISSGSTSQAKKNISSGSTSTAKKNISSGDPEPKEDDPTEVLITAVARMITEQLVPGLLHAHNATQEQLDGFGAAFDHCPVPQASSGAAQRADAGAAAEAKFTQHAQCRQAQRAAAAQDAICQEVLGRHAVLESSTCNALKILDSSQVDPTLCSPTDPYEQWLIMASAKAKALKETLAEKQYACGNATQLHDDKKPECEATARALKGNQSRCDGLQTQAEVALCVSASGNQGECRTYDSCYGTALDTYTRLEPGIRAMQFNWTVQWREMKRMECLLEILMRGGNNEDIDECKEKTYPTDHLDLDYPITPPKAACPFSSDALPCEAGFVSKYYGGLPPTAPAAACTPCSSSGGGSSATGGLPSQTIPQASGGGGGSSGGGATGTTSTGWGRAR